MGPRSYSGVVLQFDTSLDYEKDMFIRYVFK